MQAKLTLKQALNLFRDPETIVLCLFLLGALLAGTLVLLWVKRWVQQLRQPETATEDYMQSYHELVEQGLLAPEEFDKICTQVDARLAKPDANGLNSNKAASDADNSAADEALAEDGIKPADHPDKDPASSPETQPTETQPTEEQANNGEKAAGDFPRGS